MAASSFSSVSLLAFFFFFFFSSSSLLTASSAEAAPTTTHVVGESSGWTIPNHSSDYSRWASSRTFYVGDVLGETQHNTTQHNKKSICSLRIALLLLFRSLWISFCFLCVSSVRTCLLHTLLLLILFVFSALQMYVFYCTPHYFCSPSFSSSFPSSSSSLTCLRIL